MKFAPLLGAAQLAVGKGEGITRFGDSRQSFLASLAPLIAFPLAGALLLAASGKFEVGVAALLLTLVAQLAPPVVSHWLAVRWLREEEWLRFATAFNWCQWAIPMVGIGLLVVLQMLVGSSMSAEGGGQLLILLLGSYGLWLHWTVARHGLDLSRGRAALMVVLVNAATVVLVMAPRVMQSVVE